MLGLTDIKRLEYEAQVRYIQDLHDKLPDDPMTVLEFKLYAAIAQDIEAANEVPRAIEDKIS